MYVAIASALVTSSILLAVADRVLPLPQRVITWGGIIVCVVWFGWIIG